MGKSKFSQEVYVDAYEILGSAGAVAKHFKVSDKTVRKHLHNAGITLVPGRRKGDSPAMPHWGCLAKFLLDHPGTILPRSVREIVKITGCTPDAVKTYLYRRRAAVRKRAKTIDFSTGTFVYEGHTYPWKAAKDLDVYVDPYTFQIHVTGIIPATGKSFSTVYHG